MTCCKATAVRSPRVVRERRLTAALALYSHGHRSTQAKRTIAWDLSTTTAALLVLATKTNSDALDEPSLVEIYLHRDTMVVKSIRLGSISIKCLSIELTAQGIIIPSASRFRRPALSDSLSCSLLQLPFLLVHLL